MEKEGISVGACTTSGLHTVRKVSAFIKMQKVIWIKNSTLIVESIEKKQEKHQQQQQQQHELQQQHYQYQYNSQQQWKNRHADVAAETKAPLYSQNKIHSRFIATKTHDQQQWNNVVYKDIFIQWK